MKKVYLLITAICLTALTGCIKEEPFKLEQVSLSVSLETRSGATTTQEQGDKIEDAMLWAFKCTLDTDGKPVVTDQNIKATGWRYVPNVSDTYKELANIHIPLDVCVEDGQTVTTQSYVLFAVINTKAFDPNFSLGSNTSYKDLTEALFADNGAFWNNYPMSIYNEKGQLVSATPEVMPVSNWATFTVQTNNDGKNTHPNNCYSLTLPVYRAVAKTQLYMRKESSDFTLKVWDAKVVSSGAPENGAMFTKMDFETSKHATKDDDHPSATNYKVATFGYPNQTDGLSWWQEPTFKAVSSSDSTTGTGTDSEAKQTEFQMNNTPATDSAEMQFEDKTISQYAENTYDWVASTFLFENDQNIEVNANYSDVTTDKGGYYMVVKYQVDNNEPTYGYVPLRYVVRNHDYQIHATVEAGGKLSFGIYVNEWNIPDPKEYNFQSEISVSDDGNTPGVLNWTTSGNISTDDAKKEKTIPLFVPTNATDKPYATCTFHLATPEDATWRAALVGGNINAFELIGADGQVATTLSGPVGSPAEITIRAKNQTVTSNMEAYLDIVVVTNDGRTLGTVGALCGGYRQKITQIAK